jgi:hypothetical protein
MMNQQIKTLLSNEGAQYDLDDLVHETAAAMASDANNGGATEQVSFLRKAGWTGDQIAQRLADAQAVLVPTAAVGGVQPISLDHPIQCGETLYFLDPDNSDGKGGASGWYEVVDAPLVIEDDSVTDDLTDDDYNDSVISLRNEAGSELEAYPSELSRRAPSIRS